MNAERNASMNRRHFLSAALAGGFVSWQSLGSTESVSAETQTRTSRERASGRGPIIDVHMHAYPADALIPPVNNRLTGKHATLTNGEAHLQACLAEMKRLNIVMGVVSGGSGDRLAAASHWYDSAPGRFIPAASLRGSAEVPLPELGPLRKAFEERRLRVLGELTAQYAGLSLSSAEYEPYLALAEEFDVPIALHTGIGPAGISYDPCCHGFRARLGNPAHIEEALNRHPKLRVNLMHAGWPYLQDTLATLHVYPQVYVDIGWLNWGLPRAEFHAYLGALVRAGRGERVMFGSDQMYWPEAIGMAVDAVDSATFLTPAQKRDIYYNNAVRFFRLKEIEGARKTP
jgi:predicted TIM-barrel fold metal-dependent hydrolase